MSTDTISTFEQSLSGLADSVHRTTGDAFPETLAELIETPAVGVSLPYEGVSLEDTAVELDPSPDAIRTAATGVTPVGMGIATYGTLTVRSRAAGDELVSLYADRHVAVVAASDVVSDMDTAFDRLADEFDDGMTTQVFATGPSATGDLGGLIQGVHGPEGVDVIVLEDR